MSNEHIGRLEKLGLGKESTPGTAVAAAVWLPKIEGALTPEITSAKDNSAYGTIDELREGQTVKQMSVLSAKGIARDKYVGHLLHGALGTSYPCLRMTISGGTGTFVKGETVTGGTSGATGVIRRKLSATVLLVSITAGTFQTGETITGGTSAATGAAAFDSALRTHLFERLNSNAHPSYTVWGVDDVGGFKAPYSLVDTLEFELAVGGYLNFNVNFKGKKEVSDETGVPAYTSENSFLAKYANLYLASALSGLDAASAVAVESFKITISKNLEDYQAFGATDIASIHNKTFKVVGEITALFNSATLKTLVTASTKQAMRLKVENTDVTIGTAGKPLFQLELAQVSFESWSKNGGNDDLVRQTLGFEMEYSVTDAEGIVAMLQNIQTTAY